MGPFNQTCRNPWRRLWSKNGAKRRVAPGQRLLRRRRSSHTEQQLPPLPPFSRQHCRSSALRAPPLLHALASHTAASPSVQCSCLAAPTVEIKEVLAPSPPRPHAAHIEEVWMSRIEDSGGGINDELGKGANNACSEQVQGVGCRCGVGAGGVEGIYGGRREEGVVGGDEAGGAVDQREAAQERGGPVEDKARVRIVGVAGLERLEVGDSGRG
uniref:Uncharacterized protein n=2 Tax=Oryza sativa subsp. japonica TaxID=39947 RepID=Q10IF7_ORYSJ|nr:hypothetical protein [Oryza sativa Japonica Group]ABF97032.1 hypothetical protein LOC_Os03g35370 [Oryza sativa Japonica Group]